MKLSKTVYSLIYPESRDIIKNLWEQKPLYLYEEAYLKHQDKYHYEFLKKWQEWASPVLEIDFKEFKYSYPANGSSEAIREVLAYYASESRVKGIKPTIHVFQGEYEGYEAYGKSYSIEIVKHDRSNWKVNLNQVQPGHYFILSQPSSIDGNIWLDYDNFMTELSKKTDVSVLLDLCYVGCVAKEFKVNIKYPIIKHCCFSLSKVFGVYYHRIGGIFSKTELPGLHGNIWFKNLFSLLLGKTLMENFSVFELPKKYENVQNLGLQDLPTWQASDVIFLINSQHNTSEFIEYNRGPNYRACLTPLMDKIMKGKK